ncbi:flagellar biosynthetic protein FliR [Pararhizobium haloflavum]|uniref:flagellar biosynthetic protein FliR n=1 Tax=Pararhizobium haloflavum TaxID=2037914 RepID=UPI000C178A7E|nr:flagellar biosynthetic protein FliR [Pararhizobium haloflavum]
MIGDPEGTVLAMFAAFCRVGACFMLLPGLGTLRVPMMIRLFVSVAVSFSILPILWDAIYPQVSEGGPGYIGIVGVELLIGTVIGLLARYYVLALQFAGSVISMLIGFNAMPGVGIDEMESQTSLSAMLSFVGLLILFMLDYHHIVIVSLTNSYDVMPLGLAFDSQLALVSLTDTLLASFTLILQLSAPFIIYGLAFNLAVGMVNKLAPQIPVYFISIPFLLAGGLILLYLGSNDFFRLFGRGFEPIFTGTQ